MQVVGEQRLGYIRTASSFRRLSVGPKVQGVPREVRENKKFSMKSTIIVCALVVLACLCLQAKATCYYKGQNLTTGVHYNVSTKNCRQTTCTADGSILELTCPEIRCPKGKQTGVQKADLKKPYPQCCARPICAK